MFRKAKGLRVVGSFISKCKGQIAKVKILHFSFCILHLAFILLTLKPVFAQEPFYKGKTIRIVVCCTPGGLYDRWARLLARYMPKYIAGNPEIIVQNMPGASGIIATNYVYNVAKPDGLTVVMPLGSTYLAQMTGHKEIRFDVRKLNWIGTQEKSTEMLYMRADAPYKTVDDIVKAKEPPKCGSTGPASSGHIVPNIVSLITGAAFNIVSGYPGGSEIDLAAERGEIHCRGMTIPPHFAREPFISWHKKGFDIHIVQTGRQRDARMPDVPTIYELMDQYKPSEKNRRIARVLAAGGEFGRPFAVAPGVPPERIEILRRAYAQALKDPELIAEAKKGKLDVEPTSGEELQTLAKDVMDQPSEIIDQVKKLLGQ